ncbi:hypothetical protein ASG73_14860 [Janibacter sp. Soil728]|uniref:DUF4229 domain-containing protein n=1 Tax=Janibacter sp. Soil728 TaxID=1736393 RepID=UPI0006F53D60|nr:DUF4229 domain-containing protein [Janibacter sp. Soil728]KRE35950.1 hypothetical protein ASG73_14860 [Janibacter sp. Soil728]
MVRYTLLRMMIFFGCLALLWLVGLREPTELPWLVVGAALASMIISAVVLRPFRAEMIQQIQDRQAAKENARSARTDTDEAVEDAARERSDAAPLAKSADEEPETFR